jgi:hypothetical protein
MQAHQQGGPPWALWPFAKLWDLLAALLKVTGRAAACILGLIFMIGGMLLTITLIGAPVGVPFIIVGFLLVIRSIF